MDTYRLVIDKHMRHAFGKVEFAVFFPVHVRHILSDMTKTGKSPATIKHARGILSAYMSCAIETGIRNDNPVEKVLLTGLRVGELCVLRWADIDLNAATMRVKRQLRQVNRDDSRVEPP